MNRWLLALLAFLPLGAGANGWNYESQPLSLPTETENLVLADLDGDERREIIAVFEDELRIYPQGSAGFDFEHGFIRLEFQARAVGWDIASGFSSNGHASIVALLDGDRVQAWQLRDGALSEPETLLSNLGGFLSRGINRLHFVRDVNADGLMDLVTPAPGALNIHLRLDDGGFRAALPVESDMRVRTNLNARGLFWRSGQAVTIPALRLRDLNSDGHPDLISETDELLAVFLADPQAPGYFPSSASYSVDIAEIEERLGEFDVDNLDFSNLTGVLALTHEEILEDVDADGIEDLVLREGGKISLFAGSGNGMDLENPRQVLRSGGNVLGSFLHDENGDGLKDLWLWRVESISLGDVFLWLVLSSDIAVEALVYPNDGERFARRPSRRITVSLQIPSLVGLAGDFRDLTEAADATRSADIVSTATAQLDSELDNLDLLVLMDRQLQVFFDGIRPEPPETEFLGALDYSRGRDDYRIDLRAMIDDIAIGENRHLREVEGRSADLSIDLGASLDQGEVLTANLDGDDVADVLVLARDDAGRITGMMFLSRFATAN
ncbi:MAG: VCBS repeat-containing protein [Gammaproteobacteria bacterium]|nr:VCBS repeat-containing protein [Gammaproteobacteria bacterium]MDE0480197.1 VCBS repeat-containing protein [Gammaproteobacteria bacterium]MDE0508847.1 VCBS repeat-containing protein [Gammaproteobacteria bacterium]